MNRFLYCFFIIILNTYSGSAQTESINSKYLSNKIVQFYNNSEYDSIFNLFSKEMSAALPLNKCREFFSSLKSKAGNITHLEFIKYHQTYASYKANFERALFAINISSDDNEKVNGFYVNAYTDETLNMPVRNITKLILPFKNEWTVNWGGDTKELNYHVESKAQKNAFDFVITDGYNKTYKTTGKENEDYYAFGKDIIAPCNGEIVMVVDGVKDNKPGIFNPIYIPGNTVILKTANNEYLFFAHFKQNSISVKQGDFVVTGQFIGLCGNTGNSSEPHLHFHIQNVEDMNDATGIKCYFENVIKDGKLLKDYSPIRKDKIRNK